MDDPGDRDSRRTRNAHCLGTSAPFPPYPPYPPNPPYPPYAPYPIPRRPLPQNVPPPAGTDAGGSGGGPGGGGQLGDGAREPPLVFPDSVVVRRPDDLLVCTLRFVGFAFLRDPPRLVRAAAESLIILEFPPQSFGEEAFLLVSGQSVVPDKTQEVTNNKDYRRRTLLERMPRCRRTCRRRASGWPGRAGSWWRCPTRKRASSSTSRAC